MKSMIYKTMFWKSKLTVQQKIEKKRPLTPNSSELVGLLWSIPFVPFLYLTASSAFRFDTIHLINMAKVVAIAMSFSVICHYVYRHISIFGAALITGLSLIAMFAYLEKYAWFYWIGVAIMAIRLLKLTSWLSVRKTLPYLSATAIIGVLLLVPYFSLVYSEPFNAARLVNAAIHNDTLYHAAIAAMIKTHQVISHGLHGVGPLEYHFGSHILMAGTSVLTGLSVWETYSYFFVFFCAPLVGIAIVGVAEEWLPSKKRYDFFIKLGVFGILILGSGILTPGSILARYAVWPSFYESESYAISLIALMAVVSVLKKLGTDKFDYWLILILLLGVSIVTTAKISTGAFSLVLVGFWALLSIFNDPKGVWITRLIVSLACFVLFVILAPFISPVGSAATFEPLQFVRVYVQVIEPLWLKTLLFIQVHFLFSILAVGFLFLNYLVTRTWPQWLPKWYVCGGTVCLAVGLAAVLLLRVQGGSAAYFSNPSMFLALPVLLVAPQAFIQFYNFCPDGHCLSKKILHIVGIFSASVGFLGVIKYGPSALNDGMLAYLHGMRRPSRQGLISGYISQLDIIRNNSPSKTSVVFIPRTERGYWDSLHCNASGYLLSAISERPSLYAWPSPTCYEWLCGPRFHSDGLCEESQKNHTDDELIREAKRLGFEEVYIVTSGQTRVLH